MPELPEVETTRLGLMPHILGQKVIAVDIRQPQLRWPVTPEIHRLIGQTIIAVERRGKYLLLRVSHGCVILHLGMSGSIRILSAQEPIKKHDHVDLVFETGICLRLRDPRRFGAVLWTEADPLNHVLLKDLGQEPLARCFNFVKFFQQSRNRQVAVKNFIMNSKIIVGVGNIYASEVLFRSGIHPKRPAGRVSRRRFAQLLADIQQVLTAAIRQGGTTLRDFTASDGKPGYFQQALAVYGRAGEPCVACARPISLIRLGQRSTYYCKHCQR